MVEEGVCIRKITWKYYDIIIAVYLIDDAVDIPFLGQVGAFHLGLGNS